MRWAVVITLVLIVGKCEGWIPPIHSHGLSRPHSSSGRLRETASTFARYAIPPAPTVVNMEEDDGDDEADEEGGLLGFKEETEFLDQMKALIEKTSAFSTKRNEEAYEEQRERKTEMLEELKRIDGAVGVNEEIGAGNSGGDAMMSKEGLVEELRKAFSSETKEPELEDFMPEIESDDYGANAMADMLDATAATDAVDENAINRLREAFGSSRENVDGKRAGASKASQMLQAAASSAEKNSEAQSRLTSSDPVADSITQAKSNLLESLSGGLPAELRALKKCPRCKKPATQAELDELGKCSFCRQAELTVPRPLLARGITTAPAAGTDKVSTGSTVTAAAAARGGGGISTPTKASATVPRTADAASQQASGKVTSPPLPRAPPTPKAQAQPQAQAQAQAQAPKVYIPRPRSEDGEGEPAYGDMDGGQVDGGYRGDAYSGPDTGGYGYYSPAEGEEDRFYPGGVNSSPGMGMGGMYNDPYAQHDDYDQPTPREAAVTEHLMELEREVLYLRALVKQMEEGLVPQIDDLRNRMDAVMQVLWNTGAVG